MPTDLDNGYKKPNTGESGNVFCPVLEDNWTRISTHNHDGSNSNSLKSSDSIAAASWVVDGNLFKQTITIADSKSFDLVNLRFTDASTGEVVSLEYKKNSDFSYDVWTNDDSITYTVLYI